MNPDPTWIDFKSVRYTGRDVLAEKLQPGEFLNPIQPGFYPDPSICRVGGDFYLVHSTFAYFPGVPIFHSRDLVNWKQIGHVLDRPAQFPLKAGTRVSDGIYAPTISHHDGVFYMVTTFVNGGGNFYVTAEKPEGPWSEPIWLRDVHGIDPSFFRDDDGKAYVLNNGGPPEEKSLYDGHRAIWMQEMDFAKQQSVGPRRIVIDGGVDISKHPIWIEGPHLFKRDGWYMLHAAEGGTGPGHSQVVFRSRSVWGPYEPWKENPILTQRDLPHNRSNLVMCTGHADLVDTPSGDWWAVFLGVRPAANGHELTGRETFLHPVKWEDGWPRILPHKTELPRILARPKISGATNDDAPAKDFTVVDDFSSPNLHFQWTMLRRPTEQWYSIDPTNHTLHLKPRPIALSDKSNPTFLGRRIQHGEFEFQASVTFGSSVHETHTGLAMFQDDEHHLLLRINIASNRAESVSLEKVHHRADEKHAAEKHGAKTPQTLATSPLPPNRSQIDLRIRCAHLRGAFYYRLDANQDWKCLADDVDVSFLSTYSAGGFTGAMVGLFAIASA